MHLCLIALCLRSVLQTYLKEIVGVDVKPENAVLQPDPVSSSKLLYFDVNEYDADVIFSIDERKIEDFSLKRVEVLPSVTTKADYSSYRRDGRSPMRSDRRTAKPSGWDFMRSSPAGGRRDFENGYPGAQRQASERGRSWSKSNTRTQYSDDGGKDRSRSGYQRANAQGFTPKYSDKKKWKSSSTS
jgi:hypothetical protein